MGKRGCRAIYIALSRTLKWLIATTYTHEIVINSIERKDMIMSVSFAIFSPITIIQVNTVFFYELF